MYAFDPDNGRLAVTTPAYNTAIVAVNRDAFLYGGIELARLFDGRQRPVGGIGGRPPASFGLRVRDAAGRVLLATQLAKRPGGTPLRLTEAPAGAGARASTSVARAYAGSFRGCAQRAPCRRPGSGADDAPLLAVVRGDALVGPRCRLGPTDR